MSALGNLIIISAASGAGKTSLITELVNKLDNLIFSVSYTTRGQRPGEVEGSSYHFVDKATFESMIKQGDFLEYAEVFGNLYGTSRSWVSKQLLNGIDIILEIDWQGARQICRIFPEAISVFVLPPSREALEQRLYDRKQDADQIIKQRMQQATEEMSHYHEYDYLIINDDFTQALDEVRAIVIANRVRMSPQQQRWEGLLGRLLAI